MKLANLLTSIMKKSTFVFIGILLFASCKKEKISEDNTISLISKWHVETDNSTSQPLGASIQKTTTTYIKGEQYLEFSNNNKVSMKNKDGIKQYSYIYNNAAGIVDIDFGNGRSIRFQIKELTRSRLVLYTIYTETIQTSIITYTQELICNRD